LPALLAPGNLDALDRPLLMMHTDERGKRLLTRVLGLLTRHAQVEIGLVPQDVLDQAHDDPANKYWLLGTSQQLAMQVAKCMGYDYHMLYPDVVYARGFFAGLARMIAAGHKVVLHGSLCTKLDQVVPLLRKQNFDVPAADLTALALDHLHEQNEQFVINGTTAYPSVPLFLAVGPGAMHYMCPHYNIVYMAHEVLAQVPLMLFNTVDACLANLIPDDVTIAAPTRHDGMTWIELSDDRRVVTPADPCGLDDLAVRFWVMCWCEPKYQRMLSLDCEMPLPADHVSPFPAMSEDTIAAYKKKVRGAIAASEKITGLILPEVAGAFERGRTWKK